MIRFMSFCNKINVMLKSHNPYSYNKCRLLGLKVHSEGLRRYSQVYQQAGHHEVY